MKTIFEGKRCFIKQNGHLVATGEMGGSLYKLDVDTLSSPNNVALLSKDLGTWHRRLAHIDPASIRNMCNDGTVTGLRIHGNESSDFQCDACIFGKSHRQSFPSSSTSRTSRLLALVHSDVNGPLETPSLGGSRYFITFINDFSKWRTVYMMKKKSDSFKCFTTFHKMAETHTGAKIENVDPIHRCAQPNEKLKSLRTDNGGEYLSDIFKSYLNEHGIIHQTTVAYTPQQNGVAERMNRTLIDLVRSMLHSAALPKSFWAEALQTAVYIRNRVLSRSLPERTTPHHCWHGSAPDMSHCRTFGSTCFYVQPKQNIKKLDARSRQAIFIGYLQNTKGYKL